ncbi:M15 family metallopeptidase [Sphingomonas yantingensis]|uniref:Peptidoglycan L-alanyl-D-glutamate endopeptidase CwlK n=1 Tax=Sphingomonas yantingensis TaxID=1241761 RepID=A0A7W9ASZ4_9SPHN|nr:M15 family metallopeptidase [Sphingomonas yantingensis]MBB5700030.1 peptidoglycan L-alanyl-D-glutamate endopeptidase CwlK [Sphingomonas yantingensis]
MPFTLSERSLTALVGVDPRLVAVVRRAIEITKVDFMVVEGVRTQARQSELYAQGRTKPGKIVTWTRISRHMRNPVTGWGEAVDLLPAPYDWKDVRGFDAVADAMMQAAREKGVKLRHGADWDGDGARREKGETDNPHFELAK